MIRSNRFVDDSRFDHARALRWSGEHAIGARSWPSGRRDRRRSSGCGIGPERAKNVHDLRIRSGVHVPGQDRRLTVLVDEQLIEIPGVGQSILRIASLIEVRADKLQHRSVVAGFQLNRQGVVHGPQSLQRKVVRA